LAVGFTRSSCQAKHIIFSDSKLFARSSLTVDRDLERAPVTEPLLFDGAAGHQRGRGDVEAVERR
jgi:hypothetical protein